MRRGALVSLAAIFLLAFAGAAVLAVFGNWLPAQASEQRERIDFIFWLATWICIAVFALVAAVSVYAAWKFRARPDDDTDGPPIHGHTGLEIAWTAVPALLVTVLGVASAVVLAQNERTGADTIRIKVTAQQFAWSFEYPNGVTSGSLRLPINRTVKLDITARDVIHSFWVPQFGQKKDAVPGIFTDLVITPTKLGKFPVVCAELCGVGHSIMRSKAIVMTQAGYDRWLTQAKKEGSAP